MNNKILFENIDYIFKNKIDLSIYSIMKVKKTTKTFCYEIYTNVGLLSYCVFDIDNTNNIIILYDGDVDIFYNYIKHFLRKEKINLLLNDR